MGPMLGRCGVHVRPMWVRCEVDVVGDGRVKQ